MSISLTPSQEQAIEGAIRSGRVQSVDEFIATAVKALPNAKEAFNAEAARSAGERIRELRKAVALDRGGMSIREMAHVGHKY